MKRCFVITILLFTLAVAFARTPIEIKLPNRSGSSLEDNLPVLYVYPAASGNGKAVIACPGGAYQALAMEHEGKDLAEWFNKQGITYAVLKYQFPKGEHSVPLSNALDAVRVMKKHATEWNCPKIGIMGFSAGGHLASTAATHFTPDARPDFQILFYPVIMTSGQYAHTGSINNLMGKDAPDSLKNLYANEKHITPQTPPAFILHSSDDNAVPVQNSISYYLALIKNKVPATLHIYPTGGHGWGYRESFLYKSQWMHELEQWLREQ